MKNSAKQLKKELGNDLWEINLLEHSRSKHDGDFALIYVRLLHFTNELDGIIYLFLMSFRSPIIIVHDRERAYITGLDGNANMGIRMENERTVGPLKSV